MLSWQRICALARRSAGPLFFIDEQDPDDPLVVLPLRTYESLLARHAIDPTPPSARKIPVRIEAIEKRLMQEASLEKGLAPDLLEKKDPSSGASDPPLERPEPATPPSEPLIQTPPTVLDHRSLEERFYFQTPSSDEYG